MNNQVNHKALVLGSLSALALAVSSQAAAFDVQAGNTNVSIYGYAKLDMIYDVDGYQVGERGQGNGVNYGRVATGDQEEGDGNTNFHAYQSRFGFKTATPTDQGDLIVNIEGDFYGGGGGELRLRHAYGSWNGVTAGQTWTNFNTFISDTPTLDFTGPSGRAGTNRQAQLRYSSNGFHVALEAPNGSMSGTSYDTGTTFDDQALAGTDADRQDALPDLTLRYEGGAGSVKYASGALLRQVAYDDGTNDDSATGWGLFLAGSLDVASGTTIRGQVVGGEGIGGYLNGNPAPAAYVIGGELEGITSWGGTVGVSQQVGPGAINLVYSRAEADWDDAEGDGLDVSDRDETHQLVHLNYIWKPQEHVTYGVEVSRAMVDEVNGDDGAATRLQGSVIYSF